MYKAPVRGRGREVAGKGTTSRGGLLIVVSHPLRLVVGNTQAWLTFAEWLTQWV